MTWVHSSCHYGNETISAQWTSRADYIIHKLSFLAKLKLGSGWECAGIIISNQLNWYSFYFDYFACYFTTFSLNKLDYGAELIILWNYQFTMPCRLKCEPAAGLCIGLYFSSSFFSCLDIRMKLNGIRQYDLNVLVIDCCRSQY